MTSPRTLTLAFAGTDVLATSVVTYVIYLEVRAFWYIMAAIYVALWLSAALFMAWLLRNEHRISLTERSVLQATACKEFNYMFLRDVLTCNLGRPGVPNAVVCVSFQDGRLYLYRYFDAAPSEDPRDFTCVRFEAGVFDSRGSLSVFKGRGKFLLPSGKVGGGNVEVYYTSYNGLDEIRESVGVILKILEGRGQ